MQVAIVVEKAQSTPSTIGPMHSLRGMNAWGWKEKMYA